MAALIDVGLPLISFAWMSSVLVPFSLKVIFSLSPRSRLMPLNEASSASLSSWSLQFIELLDQILAHVIAVDRVRAGRAVERRSSVPLAPPTVRSVVERFWMRSLPPSFEATTLPLKAEVPLIAVTS